jgi:Ca2+:H+ antiporter
MSDGKAIELIGQPGAALSDEADGPVEEPHEHVRNTPPVLRDGWSAYLKRSCSEVFLTSWMNILLIFVPFSIISNSAGWSDGVTFVFTLLALCPLAERISFVTEDLAKYTNDTLGGLLNASMGNVTEMIVSLTALSTSNFRLVQVSLLGSVLSNLLLVLGTAFLVGGIKHSSQKFNKNAAVTNTGLLNLALMSLAFPSILSATHDASEEGGRSVLILSRVTGLFMLIIYGLMVYYQLHTHKHLFEGQEEGDDSDPVLGMWGALVWMGGITVLIAVESDIVVEVIKGASSDLGIPELFIYAILLPIVGNAAEHAAAIIFAFKNKMEICLGIALGSATQISVFVIPLVIVVGWMIGKEISLDFHIFETATVLLALLISAFTLNNGESDWLRGVMLIAAYTFISIAFWVHKDPAQA